MALSAEHRSILYTEFAERLGPDVTEAFLAYFPARDGDDPITKDFLRGELGDVRGELQGQMTGLRDDLQGQMTGLRDDLQGQMASLRDDLQGQMTALRSHVDAELAATRLAFTRLEVRYAETETQIAKTEASLHRDAKRQLTIIVTAIIGMGSLVIAAMGVSVTVLVTRLG